MDKVAIIGLRYVGLPLALQFARKQVNTLGIDIDQTKIAALKRGESYIEQVPSTDIQARLRDGCLTFTTDFAELESADAIIVCVPTPLTKNREPDLAFVLATAGAISRHLRRGAVVVLESTAFPGTTDGEFRSALEGNSGLKTGVDFHFAFSPERIDPGNPQSELKVTPMLVGGLTPVCTQRASELYIRVVREVIPVSSCRVAEAAKPFENIFRSVNIALVNELQLIYATMGIDIWEVIDTAKTTPFGSMPFHPGPGLCGHCIPIDPLYLTWKAREYGQHTRFIELAGEINTAMPQHVVARTAESLNSRRRSVNGSRILILDLAYKGNIDDQRESPSFALFELLTSAGATVDYYDPHIRSSKPHESTHSGPAAALCLGVAQSFQATTLLSSAPLTPR